MGTQNLSSVHPTESELPRRPQGPEKAGFLLKMTCMERFKLAVLERGLQYPGGRRQGFA